MERTRKEIVEACQNAHVFSCPVNTVEDLLKEEQLNQRGFWVDIDHPVAGKLTYPGRPALAADLPWLIRRPAPLLGEHNEEIYTVIGYTKGDISTLRQMSVI
jgi:crotonobetainyl-CoA:carnitine CoA-transferase CaiB-like acyl-CoA transferase